MRVTAAHTAEARAEARREAGEGGVAAAAAALAPGSFLGLPASFSEEGNRAGPGGARPVWGRLSRSWQKLGWPELRARQTLPDPDSLRTFQVLRAPLKALQASPVSSDPWASPAGAPVTPAGSSAHSQMPKPLGLSV